MHIAFFSFYLLLPG